MAPITKNKKIITAACITIFAIIFMIADIIHYNNQPIIYNTLPGGHPANYIIIDPKCHRYAETTLSKKAAIKAAHNLPESTYKANNKHSILYYNEKKTKKSSSITLAKQRNLATSGDSTKTTILCGKTIPAAFPLVVMHTEGLKSESFVHTSQHIAERSVILLTLNGMALIIGKKCKLTA